MCGTVTGFLAGGFCGAEGFFEQPMEANTIMIRAILKLFDNLQAFPAFRISEIMPDLLTGSCRYTIPFYTARLMELIGILDPCQAGIDADVYH